MPRGFNEDEKATIKASLIQNGRKLFEQYGLRKTSVEEITNAAGIAKGTFYTFYPSKEELLMDIFEKLETEIRDSIVADMMSGELTPREKLTRLFEFEFDFVSLNPLIKIFLDKQEYTQLMRRLPAERMAHHFEGDDDFARGLIDGFRASGELLDEDPAILSGMFRGLFFLNYHKKEIGEDIYPDVIKMLIRLLTNSLIPDTNKNEEK